MSTRKRKFIYTDRNGEDHEFEGFTLDLSKGSLDDLIGDAIDAEEDDKIIKEKSREIKEYINKNKNSKTKLKYWYKLGKILQFVDDLKLNSKEDQDEALLRIFKDLEPVWGGKNSSKIKRYPYHMYTLSKLPEDLVLYEGMTWSRWFDILEYRKIVKNKDLLIKIIEECCKGNWTESKLRKELQKYNKQISDTNGS